MGFVTSVVVSLIIFRLSKSKTKTDITTLLIVGIAISSFLGAFTSFSIYMIGQDSFRIVTWMMGYIGAASWLKVSILIVPLVISIMYFYLKRHELDLLLSGDEEAHSLGLNVGKLKKNMLIVSSLIVGFSVAFTGMIGFVGLIVPHTIRLLAKSSSNTKLIPLSTLGGGLFLLICDTIGRMVLNPIEIPIGVVTAFFGVWQWDGYSLIGGGIEKGETIEESIVREVKEETGLTIMPDKIIHQATTFFKRNSEAQANQSIQLYFIHSQLHGQINNDNITDSEKTYTNGTPEWVDLGKIDDINFRHSVSLRRFYGRMMRRRAKILQYIYRTENSP